MQHKHWPLALDVSHEQCLGFMPHKNWPLALDVSHEQWLGFTAQEYEWELPND